jgi:outer membrane protein assembly factor BamB
MSTSLAFAVVAAVLPLHPDPDLARALALHRAGRHAEALAAANSRRAQLLPEARLTRWAIPFEGRTVKVVAVGRSHLVITTHASRGAVPGIPAGPVTKPTLDDGTGVYDFDTVITGFDAVTGRRLWTRRAPGHVDVTIDDRADAVYVLRERLFRLNPDTGATEADVGLQSRPDRIEALVIDGRPHFGRNRGWPYADPHGPVRSYDVDTGKTVVRDVVAPLRLSTDERRVLGFATAFLPGGYGTTLSARLLRGDQPDWMFAHPSASGNEPFWLDGDVIAMIGDPTSKAEVVRLAGETGEVRWRYDLPRGAYAPGRDQLRDGSYPGRTWSAVGMCGDHLLAIGGEGSLFFLDPKTGKPAAKATPSTTHLTFPRVVNGALIVSALDGVRAIPVDVLLRRRAADEGDWLLLRVRCLHAMDRPIEAWDDLDGLLAIAPEREEAWAVRADLARAAGRPLDEVAARCRVLELTGRDADPELRARWGLVKRIASGHDLRTDLKAAGDTVYAGTSAGWVYAINTRTLEVERTEHPGTVARLALAAGVKAHFYGGPPQDLRGRSDDDPPSPVEGPREWNMSSGYDGPPVRWRGKDYRPLGGGNVRVLDGVEVREYKTALGPIRSWQICLSPWGPPLGYGTGGVYELDEHLCPTRRLIPTGADTDAALPAGDSQTLGLVAHTSRGGVLQVWTRDGGRMLREQEVNALGPIGWGAGHLLAVGGGYLLAAGDVAWVPASADGPAWRFGFGADPGRALPKIHFAHVSLFGTPLVRDNLVFVGCRDGAVYVFDLTRVTGR